jgi:hypothetical protein
MDVRTMDLPEERTQIILERHETVGTSELPGLPEGGVIKAAAAADPLIGRRSVRVGVRWGGSVPGEKSPGETIQRHFERNVREQPLLDHILGALAAEMEVDRLLALLVPYMYFSFPQCASFAFHVLTT